MAIVSNAEMDNERSARGLHSQAYIFALERHGMLLNNLNNAFKSIVKDPRHIYVSESKLFLSTLLDAVAIKTDANNDHTVTVAEAYNLAMQINHDAEAWLLEQPGHIAKPEVTLAVIEKLQEDRRQFKDAAKSYAADYGPVVETGILRCNLAHNIDAIDAIKSQDNIIDVSTLSALQIGSAGGILGHLLFHEAEECSPLSIEQVTQDSFIGHGISDALHNPSSGIVRSNSK